PGSGSAEHRSLVARHKAGDNGAMVRSNAPAWQRQNVSRVGLPFPRHSAIEQEVIDPAVGVLFAEVVSPGDVARRRETIGGQWQLAVFLGRPRVDQRIFSTTDDGPYRLGILEIVEVAEHDQIEVRIRSKAGV